MTDVIRIDLNSVNCYLLRTNDSFILVDTGGYTFVERPLSDKKDRLLEQLNENGCRPGNLKLIILTHGDLDHIANCAVLKQKYAAPIAIHKNDAVLLKDISLEKIFSNFKFNSLAFTLMAKLMHSMFVKISNKIIAEYQEFDADELIDESFDLTKYGLQGKIIHIPGHTKGSIGILINDGDFICGDTLANTKKPGIAMNAYDFGQLKESIRKLSSENIRRVFPGHGAPFEFAKLKKNN